MYIKENVLKTESNTIKTPLIGQKIKAKSSITVVNSSESKTIVFNKTIESIIKQVSNTAQNVDISESSKSELI